jgi:hypothetical protein
MLGRWLEKAIWRARKRPQMLLALHTSQRGFPGTQQIAIIHASSRFTRGIPVDRAT